MRSYRQYCPVARTAAIVGERWSALIVRELLDGATGFNEIHRGLPGINRSLLLSRLRELQRLALVGHQTGAAGQASRYQLTAAGHSLGAVIEAMGTWGAKWMFDEPEPDELDPHLLLWWIRRRINHDRLPPGRVVVLFHLHAGDRRVRYWLVLDRGEASICPQDPGFEVDVLVRADCDALYRVYAGQLSLADALRAGTVSLTGHRDLVKAFPAWMAWSPAAAAVRRYAHAKG